MIEREEFKSLISVIQRLRYLCDDIYRSHKADPAVLESIINSLYGITERLCDYDADDDDSLGVSPIYSWVNGYWVTQTGPDTMSMNKTGRSGFEFLVDGGAGKRIIDTIDAFYDELRSHSDAQKEEKNGGERFST